MSAYTLVLGENYVVYALGAAILGVVSALLFTEGGLSSSKPDLTALQAHATKAVLLSVFLFFVWNEADDLMDTLVKSSFPLGVYKIVQAFVSALIVWRGSKPVLTQHGETVHHG